MSGVDSTAAERARRYRARRRERDELRATVGDVAAEPALEALGDAIAALVLEVRELAELVRGKRVDNVDKRDVTRPSRRRRDVTPASRAEGAPARVRDGARSPTGSVGADERERHVTPELERSSARIRILALLEVARAPASAEAIADELELGAGLVLGELLELERLGRAARIAPADERDRLRWRASQLGLELETVTVSCDRYREHQFAHRRDPGSGRFRCYACNPDGASAPT